MEVTDYYRRCSAIHSELATIYERTRVMARTNCANDSNGDWIAVMNRQDALLTELKRLDSESLISSRLMPYSVN